MSNPCHESPFAMYLKYLTQKNKTSICFKKLSSDLEQEISIIKTKYLKAGYTNAFINSKVNNFHRDQGFFIPSALFEE